MNDLEKAKNKLFSGVYTCVLCQGEKVYASTERGVKPLVAWMESRMDFFGYSAADKVIGKATAFLYVLLGIKQVYATVVSQSALKVLQKNNVAVEYGTLVENVINRRGDGICPFEEALLSVEDEKSAYLIILKKMRTLGVSL